MSAIRLEHAPGHGARVFLYGHRLHHGLLGALSMLAGAICCWRDRADFPWLSNH